MAFRDDVAKTVGLEQAWRSGLQALRDADRIHVNSENPRTLAGSVDVDAALRSQYPVAARWDYVVAGRQGEAEYLHWIEVHPASSTGNVKELEKKLEWLAAWLKDQPLATYPRCFVWVASGRCTLHQHSRELKRLAGKGLLFRGGHYVVG